MIVRGKCVVIEQRGQGYGTLALSGEVDNKIDSGGGLARRPFDDLRLDKRQPVTDQAHLRHVAG